MLVLLSGVHMRGVSCGDLVMAAPRIDGHSGVGRAKAGGLPLVSMGGGGPYDRGTWWVLPFRIETGNAGVWRQ